MELDFFQIKLREKGNKQWSRIVLAVVHERITVLLRRQRYKKRTPGESGTAESAVGKTRDKFE